MSRSERTPLEVLDDPLSYVRSHPNLFFRRGEFDPLEAIEALARAALEAGADNVDVKRLGRWWLVAADEDWLAEADGDTAFHRITPLPSETPNRMRPEVLLTAFAKAVVTGTGSSRPRSITGRSDPKVSRWWAQCTDGARMVAFKI